MKKHVLFGFLLLAGGASVLAQNKTMGVGVATPNPNAVLHIESPTGNQGFILPRLTTAQRTAPGFTGVLGAADNGLMVYDIDLSSVFIWDGKAWGGPQLNLPYADTLTSAPNGSNLLGLVYAGSTTGNVGVARFENLNPNSSAPALWVQTNSNQPLSTPIYGLNTGTGDPAGVFRVSNAASAVSALYGEHNGSGPAIFGNQSGMGRAGQFQITNASNPENALRAVTTSGSGTALGLVNSGNGNAFTIFSGGVKVSTFNVTSASITTRAAAYRITAGGDAFTFDFGPTDGEVYMVYNDTASLINVQSVLINPGEGKTIVNFGGAFKGF